MKRVPANPDERHAAFFDAVGPRLLGRYTDGGARSTTTGRTPRNPRKSDAERAWRKAFGGTTTVATQRTLVNGAEKRSGGVGGEKPKATPGYLPARPRRGRGRR